jgi:hypothetical protein
LATLWQNFAKKASQHPKERRADGIRTPVEGRGTGAAASEYLYYKAQQKTGGQEVRDES